jgi:hypothetical protein
MRSVGPGDDRARFLADLRALRDTAAIGYEELAARAHYPSDALKEAENGPTLPSLPVLTAYVRACDGNVLEWEERWRRLGDGTRADPNLPVRPAGASAAAVAGARAGIGVAPPEAYDPDRVKAALRGDQRRSAGGGRPAPTAPVAPAAPVVPAAPAVDLGSADRGATGWDAAASRWDAPAGSAWDTSTTQQETGGGWFTAAGQDDPWNAPAADAGTSWSAGATTDAGTSWDTAAAGSFWDTGTPRSSGGSWDAGGDREAGSAWSTGSTAGAGVGREAGSGWDSGASAETAAGLGGSAGWDATAGQGLGLPNGSHHADRPARGPFEAAVTETSEAIDRQSGDARFSWLEPTTSRGRGGERPAAEPASEPAGQPGAARGAADLSPIGGSPIGGSPMGGSQVGGSQVGGRAAAAQSRASAGRVASAATALEPRSRRRNRPGMWRVLAVIVLAALLGSVLMLLLR